MAWLIIGILIGLAVAGSVAVAIGVVAYRRVVALERRTLQAERLAELGTLTGGLAHEIKNPLSTVQLNLQLLQEDIGPTHPSYPRIARRLLTIRNETARLRDILDDFLRYAGRLELDRSAVELNVLLEDLVDFFAPQAQQARVQLRLNKSPTPTFVSGDAKLLKQALLNLMLNGVQAMSGGGELILGVSKDVSARRAAIDVIDTGPGMSDEAVSKIFQAYYSTKKGGTGLGLPMTQRIITEHGGKLHVKSELGKGTDFRIELPFGAATAGEVTSMTP